MNIKQISKTRYVIDGVAYKTHAVNCKASDYICVACDLYDKCNDYLNEFCNANVGDKCVFISISDVNKINDLAEKILIANVQNQNIQGISRKVAYVESIYTLAKVFIDNQITGEEE